MNEYQTRTMALGSIGCTSYDEYLKSARWDAIRASAMQRDGAKCRSCGAPATQVHHFEYSRAVMLGIDTDGVVSVCRTCHENASVLGGKVVPPSVASERMGFVVGPKLDRDDSLGMNFIGVGGKALSSRFAAIRERLFEFLGRDDCPIDFAIRFSGLHGDRVVLELTVNDAEKGEIIPFLCIADTLPECLEDVDAWLADMEATAAGMRGGGAA